MNDQLLKSDLFSLQSPALDAARVLSIRGREAISEPYRFEIGLVALCEIDGGGIVGERATLAASLDDGGANYRWHGVVAELDLLHAHLPTTGQGQFLYRAILVPRLWRLGLSLHSRVFVGDSTPDILLKILAMNGLAGDVELKLQGDYPPHAHVCQYKESDLAFISRWMEREGLYYFFDHDGGADKLVITDASGFHDSLRDDAIRYDPRALEDASASEALNALSSRRSALPRAVELRDYDPLKPALDVFGDQGMGQGLEAAQRHFGDNFATPEEAKRLATVRSQELSCRSVVYRGAGHILRLRSGYRFEVDGHPCESFNAPMLCTELEHHCNLGVSDPAVRQLLEVADDQIYRVDIQAIPATTQFRAERKTPKPRIYGVERATIDGPTDSQYAQLDEHGRYKVKIHFDESDLSAGNASTWLRMLQPHGGDTEGFHFPLRKGTEVMLTFLGGDPDQPVIAGAAPNAHKTSPIAQDNATWNEIRTGGNNFIRINDKEGEEHFNISTPYKGTTLALGYPTIVVGFGDPPHQVDANVYLSTDGAAAFSFGTDWWVEVGGLKHEFVRGSVTEDYKSGHSVHVTGMREDTVTDVVVEDYGCQQKHVQGWKTEIVESLVEHVHKGGETITVTGDRTDVVSGVNSVNWAGASLTIGATQLDWGSTMGSIKELNLDIPSGATITTPSWKVTNPEQTWVGAAWDRVTGFSASATAVSLSYTHYKGSFGALSVSATARSATATGLAIAVTGVSVRNRAQEVNSGGPFVISQALTTFS